MSDNNNFSMYKRYLCLFDVIFCSFLLEELT